MDGEDDWDQAGADGGGAAVAAAGEDDWDTGGGAAAAAGGQDFGQDEFLDEERRRAEGEAEDGADGSGSSSNDKVLLMKFCPHDSSMLYPQEQKSTRTLHYSCRLCRYTEDARGALIYRNAIKKELGNVLATVPAAVSDDPTLPRSQNASCMNCGHHEAVFFQSDTSDIRSDSLALIFVCCNCQHKWVA
mmetsp:Transcript_17566/g.35277  ORF Transcript_17566/g.35277 Transcript_17566/m.35277 type:complete len:189 (-) Transcript_17566:761-1327(-)